MPFHAEAGLPGPVHQTVAIETSLQAGRRETTARLTHAYIQPRINYFHSQVDDAKPWPFRTVIANRFSNCSRSLNGFYEISIEKAGAISRN